MEPTWVKTLSFSITGESLVLNHDTFHITRSQILAKRQWKQAILKRSFRCFLTMVCSSKGKKEECALSKLHWGHRFKLSSPGVITRLNHDDLQSTSIPLGSAEPWDWNLNIIMKFSMNSNKTKCVSAGTSLKQSSAAPQQIYIPETLPVVLHKKF